MSKLSPEDGAMMAERCHLISKKHGRPSEFSDADSVRLGELNDWSRLKFPRVTARDWELLENLKREHEETVDFLSAIRREFGLEDES